MTMPVRLASWNTERGLAPIFEMNLPGGLFARSAPIHLLRAGRGLRRHGAAGTGGPIAIGTNPDLGARRGL